MAHPSFQDLSFEQMARRALRRACFDAPLDLSQSILQRARFADAVAAMGAHPIRSRAADRRSQIAKVARLGSAVQLAQVA